MTGSSRLNIIIIYCPQAYTISHKKSIKMRKLLLPTLYTKYLLLCESKSSPKVRIKGLTIPRKSLIFLDRDSKTIHGLMLYSSTNNQLTFRCL